jgi:hypothetical protein
MSRPRPSAAFPPKSTLITTSTSQHQDRNTHNHQSPFVRRVERHLKHLGILGAMRIKVGKISSCKPDQPGLGCVTKDLSFREWNIHPVKLHSGIERCNVDNFAHAWEICGEGCSALVIIVGLDEPKYLSMVTRLNQMDARHTWKAETILPPLHKFVTYTDRQINITHAERWSVSIQSFDSLSKFPFCQSLEG